MWLNLPNASCLSVSPEPAGDDSEQAIKFVWEEDHQDIKVAVVVYEGRLTSVRTPFTFTELCRVILTLFESFFRVKMLFGLKPHFWDHGCAINTDDFTEVGLQ